MDYQLPDPLFFTTPSDYLARAAPSYEEFLKALIERPDYFPDYLEELAQANDLDYSEYEDVSAELLEVAAAVAPAMAEKIWDKEVLKQQTWPFETDNDRLDAAYAQLAPTIIGHHDEWCCNSCAWVDYETKAEKGMYPDAEGYVFYNEQSSEKAYDSHRGLLLYFNSIPSSEERSKAVARKVFDALKDQGLKVEWSEDSETYIEVPMIWQRRLTPRS